jgi:peptidoglycan/LPS O-acetylase OafA/YrhL
MRFGADAIVNDCSLFAAKGSIPLKLKLSNRVAGLDTLRALAIVSVMAFHLNWRLPHGFEVAGKFGWMGVDLFFVLSGYLIGCQILKPVQQGRGVELVRFYRNRAYRILPAYLVVLALYLVWPGWREDTGMSPLWEFLTFTENLFVDYAKNHAFSHVWSLCVEEHFYLFLPVVVMVMAKRPAVWKTAAVLSGLCLLGIAVRSWELVHVLRPLGVDSEGYSVLYIERMYYPTYSRLDGLLAGVAVAAVRVFRPGWWGWMVRWASVSMVLGAACVGGAVWMFWDRFSSDTGAAAWSSVMGFPLLAVGLALWLPAAADVRCWFGRLRVPGAEWVATLAFSLYLTHKSVAHLVHDAWPNLMEARDWRCVVVYSVSCLGVGAMLYYGVERPFLKLRDRSRGRDTDAEARIQPAL